LVKAVRWRGLHADKVTADVELIIYVFVFCL